ncbi:hypothetical protein SAMN05192558_103249 [Actinokineospora alba]|uniref:Major Facilitator Superfamily protein n=1 Tax=Actinokineospora alba TaxID=504798 RepID=A0A1H0JWI3_9PSEU|nr:hypothetical protein C8E96_3693 [Actinokineospora alba]SDH92879.1 hypothetical protein SAMN05421871_102800 [Actinokineospora alba]SDO48148.1 hypothetical protein SAMN05192558_103249 [Actinokineospora alba]
MTAEIVPPPFSVASRGFQTWAATAAAIRVPGAMTPLALVFLVREQPDGYQLGAILAGIFVLGEMIGAALSAIGADSPRSRHQLPGGLLVGATALIVLGVAGQAPMVVLALLAFVAGLAPANAPGSLQAILVERCQENDVARALAAARVHGTIVFSVAPALVGFLALQVAAGAPLVVAGAMMAAGAGAVVFMPSAKPSTRGPGGAPAMARTLAGAWPIYVTAAAVYFLMALAELELVALLHQRDIAVGWAGPLLVGFSLVGALGAVGYGRRSWPGSYRVQCLWFTLVMSAGLVAAAVTPHVLGVGAGLLVAGGAMSCLVLARNLSLREVLPDYAHRAGFSLIYAASCLGYSVSGAFAGGALTVTTPEVAILAGIALVLVITVCTAVVERRGAPRRKSE